MRKLPALLCGVLVVTAALAAATGGAAAQDDALSIRSVDVSPDSPVPGELVTFSPTVVATGQGVSIDRVLVRNDDGETVASSDNPYSLSNGEQVELAVTGQLPPGETHNLEVVVRGTTANGQRVEATESVTIEVDQVAPNVAVASSDPVAGTESELSLRVSNTLGTEMENVRLELSAPGVEVRGSGFDPALAAGETTTFNYTVVADEPGTVDFEARLVFTTQSDDRRTIVQTVPVAVDPLEDEVIVSASVSDDDDDTLDVQVANHGDAPVDDVEVTAVVDGEVVDRTLLDDVAGHDTRSTTLDVSDAADDATVTVRTDYTVGDTAGSAETTVQLEPDEGTIPGRIELTGVTVTPEDGRLRISGSAANTGMTQVNATIVGVVDTDAVTPAQPNRDFFVGPVPANDFVSFDVYATVEGNVSSIPLRLTYLVDGERVEQTVEVPVDASVGGAGPVPAREASRPARSGGFPVIPAVGAVVVIGAAIVLWRRRS